MIAVIETGVANTASVLAGLRRVGTEPVLTTDPERVARADRVLLPGVGAFGAGMARLRETGLIEPLRRRIAEDRPTAAICLGLQLLCASSEESPGVEGLGVIPSRVRRFEPGRPVPQLGWNRVRVEGSGILQPGSAYFANSYRLTEAPEGWRVAWSDYGGPFVAALERGNLLACQFHPELSGPWGLELLRRWVGGQRTPVATQTPTGGLGVRLLPCLDVRDGRVVKGIRFQGLRDAGDPAERAAVYAEQGADELVLLDVSATDEGRRAAARTVAAVRSRIALPLTVGGGIRSIDDAERLLAAGADKISVNTAAVADPDLVARLAERFGRQCTVVAIDARRSGESWEVVVRAGKQGTGRDAIAWAREVEALGAGEILLTSMDRDGTQEGYDLDLLSAVSEAVRIPVIASGGARHGAHLADAVGAGASAVLAASILHDGDTTVDALKQDLQAAGVEVRR